MATIFRAPLATMQRARPFPSPKDEPPPNLLGNTLRPPDPPPRSFDWPNPRSLRQPVDNRGFINAVELQLIGLDQFFGAPGQPPTYDWPNPRPRFQPVRDCTSGDMLAGPLYPALLSPGRQREFPNPSVPRQPLENRGFIGRSRPDLIGQDSMPTGRLLDWPNPGILRQPVRDWVRPDLSTGVLIMPVGRFPDQPNPGVRQQPVTNRGYVLPVNLELIGKDKMPAVYRHDWPNPGVRRPPLFDFPPPNQRVSLFQVPKITAKHWPNPPVPQQPLANRGHVGPVNLNLVGQDALPTVHRHDWPNPLPIRPTPQFFTLDDWMVMANQFQFQPDRRFGGGRANNNEIGTGRSSAIISGSGRPNDAEPDPGRPPNNNLPADVTLLIGGLAGATDMPVFVGNMLFVSAAYGNDATALRGRPDLPFATLTAAKNISSAATGDTIVVWPGTYNETNLLKNGVNWYFHVGATINYTGSGGQGIWDDSALYGCGTAVTCTISGHGVFINNSNSQVVDPTALGAVFDPPRTGSVVQITNINSNVTIDCEEMDCPCGTNQYNNWIAAGHDPGSLIFPWGTAAIGLQNGTLSVTCNRVSGTNASGVWWSGGEGYLTCDQIVVTTTVITGGPYASCLNGGSGGIDSNASVAGNFWVNVGKMLVNNSTGTQYGGGIIVSQGPDDTFVNRWWVTCKEIDASAGVGTCVQSLGSFLYLIADKLVAAEPINTIGGNFWGNIQKITATAGLAIQLGFQAATANNNPNGFKLECQQIENTDTGTINMISIDNSVAAAPIVIKVGIAISNDGNVVNVVGSNTFVGYLEGAYQSLSASKVPIALNANSSIHLRNVLLVSAHSTDCVTGPTTSTVTFTGPAYSNKVVHAASGPVVHGGTLTTNANITF